MNQTIAAGIGNVYKSESLFLARINPWRLVGDLDDAQLRDYLSFTHALMRQNRSRGVRRTRFASESPRLWVYGRQDQPCLECGERIRMRPQGDLARSTYYCPRCQRVELVRAAKR